MNKFLSLALSVLFTTLIAEGQENGKFQMHFMDVGQGDAALLISPLGETVLFDEGVDKYCNLPLDYLQSLGVTKIDYLVSSHYHDDHIGCTEKILAICPLQKAAYDRGDTFPSTVYKRYAAAVGNKRKTAAPGDSVILDKGTAHPVIIRFIASNGDGIRTRNENDLSLVALVSFGALDIVMGGDLSGFTEGNYKDIESAVALKMHQVEVYKVHHHCSQYSSNATWLDTIKPLVGIISESGNYGRKYGFPTAECLERLHQAGVKTYWTEQGDGQAPDPMWDAVGGNILVEAQPGNSHFTVTYCGNKTDTYTDWGTVTTSVPPQIKYGWSRKSTVYHYMDCSSIQRILPENLETGDTPPTGKRLHEGCPQ